MHLGDFDADGLVDLVLVDMTPVGGDVVPLGVACSSRVTQPSCRGNPPSCRGIPPTYR
jgi:hypothetical protein